MPVTSIPPMVVWSSNGVSRMMRLRPMVGSKSEIGRQGRIVMNKLPINPESVAGIPVASSDAPGWLPGPQPRSILVVEDDPLIRRLLVSVLSTEGYRIESVADGNLALRILEDEFEIDLVLTD